MAIGRLSAVLVAAALAGPVRGSPAIVTQLESQEKQLLEALRQDAVWTTPVREKELLDLLKTAGALRRKSLVPVLIPRIAYMPPSIESQPHHVFSKEETYPVTAVLNGIGLPAVPEMLDRLKKLNPEDALSGAQRECALLVECLVSIYDQGGRGKELARKRLELEVEACSGMDAVHLKRFLNYTQIGGVNTEPPQVFEPSKKKE